MSHIVPPQFELNSIILNIKNVIIFKYSVCVRMCFSMRGQICFILVTACLMFTSTKVNAGSLAAGVCDGRSFTGPNVTIEQATLYDAQDRKVTYQEQRNTSCYNESKSYLLCVVIMCFRL